MTTVEWLIMAPKLTLSRPPSWIPHLCETAWSFLDVLVDISTSTRSLGLPLKTCSIHSLPHLSLSYFCSIICLGQKPWTHPQLLLHILHQSIKKSCWIYLKNLSRIKPLLSSRSATNQVWTTNVSCLGYCSSSQSPPCFQTLQALLCLRALTAAVPSACECLNPDAWLAPSPPSCF